MTLNTLKAFSLTIASSLLLTGCSSAPTLATAASSPSQAVPSPPSQTVAAVNREVVEARPTATVVVTTQSQPLAVETPRMRLRDRAAAARKAKAARKKAEEAKEKAREKAQGGRAPDTKDLLVHLPLDGSVNDVGPYRMRTQAEGVSAAPDHNDRADGAMEFSSGSYVEILGAQDFNNLEEFTLSAWVGPTSLSEHKNIISKVQPGRDFNLQLNAEGKALTHIANGNYEFCYSRTALPVGQWAFVAASFKNNEWKLYINGELDAVQRVQRQPGWTGQSLTVGNLYPGAPEGFEGLIDDVRIYQRALTAGEVKGLMAAR